jgi:hypothetical protein
MDRWADVPVVPSPKRCLRRGCGHAEADHTPLCKEGCMWHRFLEVEEPSRPSEPAHRSDPQSAPQ